MIIDSVLTSIYTSIPKDPDPLINSFVFTAFVAFFIFSNYIFLRYYKKSSANDLKSTLGIRELTSKSIVVCQIALSSILLLIMVQIFAFERYDLVLITSAIYISHLGAIGLLVLLAYQFVRWFVASKNYLIVAYAFAFGVIILSLITSLVFLSIDLSYRDPTVKMKSIKTAISDYSTYGTKLSSLADLYTYLSIISFVSIWIPSIIMLRTYSRRLGRIRYWALVSIPLIYFFFPYFGNQFRIFDNFLLEYGMEFNLIYYSMFSSYKQIGGLLFGIVFWVIASKIKRQNLKIPLRIAGIGMTLLFGSAVLHGLTFIVSPPFGLVTISFMSLASYMLLIGIFTAAKELSRDISVRREIYKIAGEHSDLLRNIGIAESNKILEKRVSGILNKMKDEIDVPLQPELEESDYKKFIEDALAEVKSSKKQQ
jgi:uncharacterized membrane protein (UPF0136 family)